MITNLQELLEHGELKHSDKLNFDGMDYSVRSDFLSHQGGRNAEILEVVCESTDKDIRMAYLKKIYGYEPLCERGWPESRLGDYAALTRAAAAIFVKLGQFAPKQSEQTINIEGKDYTVREIKRALGVA